MLNLKTLCAGLVISGLYSSPSLADPIVVKDMKKSDLEKSVGAITSISGELGAAELDRVPLGTPAEGGPFTIRGGGALVLCETAKIQGPGKDAGCTGATSDVLGFFAGQKMLTLYSDPNPLTTLDKNTLAEIFTEGNPGNAMIAYVQEGNYFKEATAKTATMPAMPAMTGKILDENGKPIPDLTGYISKRGIGDEGRLYEIVSDFPEKADVVPATEPGTLALLGTALLSLGAMRQRRPVGARQAASQA